MIRQPRHRPTARDLALFAPLWLLVGFASGTVTLLGPVRWLTGWARGSGWSDGAESLMVVSVIVTYVIASFFASLVLLRFLRGGRPLAVRCAAGAVPLLAAVGALWLWMTPSVVNAFQPVQVETVARFTFGPYPERRRFELLQEQGFEGVVSLLHGTAVPFEAVLLARERELAREFGIELIEAPMLPWIGGNDGSLAKVRKLIAAGTGRYYVHCYLGRDRVGMVRRLVEIGSPSVAVSQPARRLEDGGVFRRGSFERGPILQIDEGVYLTPFPTAEEMAAFFVSGAAAHVVSLLDPTNPEDRSWIEQEEKALAEYGIGYRNMPLSWQRFDADQAVAAAAHVRRAPKPVLVHGFLSTGVVTEAFRLAYATGRPVLPRRLFDEPLVGGVPQVVGLGVVIGPRPRSQEFGSFLARRGIRNIAHIGAADRVDAGMDREIVETETRMMWRSFAPDAADLIAALGQDGPWYVYGPGLGAVQSRIQDHFGGRRAALEASLVAAASTVAAGQ